MSGRIGTLHLHYRARASGSLGAALAPQLDRALQSRLGEALDERLSAIPGTDTTVVVIRELNARVTIGRSDWSLDSRVVDKISRASADAVAAALSAPASDDSVVRFADQAEFIGSFIVDLMGGSAWERWYYGAFLRYRQDARTTISAILEDNCAHAAAVFGWLARRGQLAAVLAHLGPQEARRLATASADRPDGLASASEIAPLVMAAFQLLEALGWPAGDAMARAALVSEYLSTPQLPPTWTDRRSLSAWVLRFVRFARSTMASRGATHAPSDTNAAHALLAGSLDWLDVEWLAPQIDHLRDGSPGSVAAAAHSMRRVLTSRHERALERIADLVRLGRIRIDRADDRDVLIVRLVSAIAECDGAAHPPDRVLIAVVERIADAWRAAIASGVDSTRVISATGLSSSAAPSLPRGLEALVSHLDGVRAAGPAAVSVLQQLVKTTAIVEEAGDLTPGAGLILLTRGILDVKLTGLARDAGVPFEPLLAALADQWLRLVPPFDRPMTMWIGAEHPNLTVLDAPGARLADLQEALLELLRDQGTVDALPEDRSLDGEPARASAVCACSDATRVRIARIAWMVMRAWSRWLPGLSGATPSFLVRNCVQRLGRVRVSNTEVAVQLDPAPLDVVLEMAGYFRPLELVPWLNRRRITFAVSRRPGA